MCPSFHLAGTSSTSQIFPNSSYRIDADSMSALSASASILSGPGALLFFRVLIAFLISPFDGLLQSTDKVSSAGRISATFCGNVFLFLFVY